MQLLDRAYRGEDTWSTSDIGRRSVAQVFDWAVWLLWIIPLGEYSNEDGLFEASWQGWRFALAWILLPAAYLVLSEWLLGATPGKLLVGIRVRRVEGGRIGFGQSVVRNLARLVDALVYVIPYLVGGIAVIRSPTRQRFGDRWAGTVVVLMGTDTARGGDTHLGTKESWSEGPPPAPVGPFTGATHDEPPTLPPPPAI